MRGGKPPHMTQNIANRRNPQSRAVPEGGEWGREVLRAGGQVIDILSFAAEGPCSAIDVCSGVCRLGELAPKHAVFLYPSGRLTLSFGGGLGNWL